jgi:hypothetical protein
LEHRAIQRNEAERARYKAATRHIPIEYLIYIDEMSVTNRRKRRRRGRAKKGKVPYMREWFEKGSENLNTLIAACNIHGMVLDACIITEYNNKREDFERYMEDALSKVLGPYPGSCILFCVSSISPS